jgi:hypothetical protein
VTEAAPRRGYHFLMDYIEFKLWKALAFLAVVAVYSFWCGFTGRK